MSGQWAYIIATIEAVLMPNSNIPSIPSSAPNNWQWRSSVSPEAPRVLIEATE